MRIKVKQSLSVTKLAEFLQFASNYNWLVEGTVVQSPNGNYDVELVIPVDHTTVGKRSLALSNLKLDFEVI